MRRDIVGSAIAIVVLTIGFGLVYPLVMTGVAQVVFHDQANGSQVERDGKVVGSSLIGQDFRKPVLDADGNPVLEADPAWFQSRPSQSGYSANATFFSNLGPNQQDLADEVKANLDRQHSQRTASAVQGVRGAVGATLSRGCPPVGPAPAARWSSHRDLPSGPMDPAGYPARPGHCRPCPSDGHRPGRQP